MEKKKIGWFSATTLVIANMIGIGAFTSLGLQIQQIHNTWSIILLWALGGLLALIGALTYAELGVHFSKSGGEYQFLSRLIHPFAGYLSGWVSFTVGFSAPIALSAMAAGIYLKPVTCISAKIVAIAIILAISLTHSFSLHWSSRFQNLSTILKLVLIFGLVIWGLSNPHAHHALDWSSQWTHELMQPFFPVALVFVAYSYSGWNAAVYIVEEIKSPAKNLPKALLIGTLIVITLYLLLQISILSQASVAELSGKVEVVQILGKRIWGNHGAQTVSIFLSVVIISGISAMTWVGPRVTRAMANDYSIWRFLCKDNRYGIPVRAIWFQACISIFFVWTSSFEQVLLYSGFVLQLMTALTVAGIFMLRKKTQSAHTYKSPGFPILQILYLTASLWLLGFMLYDKPLESLLGLINLVAGGISYWWTEAKQESSELKNPVDHGV